MDANLLKAGLKDPKILERLKVTRRGESPALLQELQSIKKQINEQHLQINILQSRVADLEEGKAEMPPATKKKVTQKKGTAPNEQTT